MNQKYCIAWKKDAFVADQIHWQNGDIHWDILFTRLVNDWELENLQYFHALLYSRYIERRGGDRMAWRPTRKGSFEVKSYYRVLSDGGIQSFTRRSIWKVKVPHKVFFPPSLGQQPKVRF